MCTTINAICQPASKQAGGTNRLLNTGGDNVIALHSHSYDTLVYKVCFVKLMK